MHLLSSTAGLRGELLSPCMVCTISIADAGQWRAQFPQDVSPVAEIHIDVLTTARPTFVELLVARSIGFIAPDGHTEEHMLHSGRQYPLEKSMRGCMKVEKSVEVDRTLFGHDVIHNWHAVQWLVKFSMLSAPGGANGVLRMGRFLSFKVVTTLPYGFSAALIAIADAITPPIARKLRLPVSGCPFSGLFLMLSSFKIVFWEIGVRTCKIWHFLCNY